MQGYWQKKRQWRLRLLGFLITMQCKRIAAARMITEQAATRTDKISPVFAGYMALLKGPYSFCRELSFVSIFCQNDQVPSDRQTDEERGIPVGNDKHNTDRLPVGSDFSAYHPQ